MSWSRPLAAGLLALVLAGAAACGFRPLYGERSAASVSASQLAAIQISLIPDREGQLLRNNLLDRLHPSGPAPRQLYRLDVKLQTSKESYGIRTDETATRANLTMVANYNLIDIASGKVLMTSRSRAISSYNILESEFATVISERDAVQRTAADLSEEIRTRLAIFLSSRQAPG
jgi:LPS-assembly lipoprotein